MIDKAKAIEILSRFPNSGFGDSLHGGAISVPEIIELLKEQEAVEPEVEVLNEVDRLYRCPRCHKYFFHRKQKYCSQCGQEVKWE